MNRTARNVLFWVFIIFFLVAAPLSVLYTAGYRYNAKNGSLVRTGGFSISSEPRNAAILLNGEPTEKSTPFVVKRIIPGTYDVELQKPGFHPWSGTVDVSSGETKNLQGILLFAQSDIEQLFIKNATDITPSPDGRYVTYIIEEGGWEEVWLFDTSSDGPRLVDRFSASTVQNPLTLTWSADGSRFAAKNAGTGLVRTYANTGEALELPPTLIAGVNDLFWHPSDGHLLYVSTQKELRQFDFDTQQIEIFDNSDAVSVLIDASVLTFTNNGEQIELHQTIGNERELIALLPRAAYEIEERDGSFLILTDARDNLTLIDLRATQPILLQTKAHSFDWHRGQDQLVYSDGNEVNIYTPEGHQTEFITRQSDFIENVSWHPKASTIFVGTGTTLSTIEAYRIAEQRYSVELANMQSIESLWIGADGKTAFLFGMEDGATGMYSLILSK